MCTHSFSEEAFKASDCLEVVLKLVKLLPSAWEAPSLYSNSIHSKVLMCACHTIAMCLNCASHFAADFIGLKVKRYSMKKAVELFKPLNLPVSTLDIVQQKVSMFLFNCCYTHITHSEVGYKAKPNWMHKEHNRNKKRGLLMTGPMISNLVNFVL